MRAAVYTRTGPASEVLQIRDRQVPIPGVGEVLVRVRGSGINPADVKRRAGWRGSEMAHPVIIPHCDGAGEIVAVGADVKSRAIDDRVWIWNAQGGYDLLVKVKPDDSSTVFIGGTNLWRSTDGFTTDSNTTQIGGYYEGSYHGQGNWDIYNNHHPDQHELLFLPSNPNIILSGNDGGVYKSINCIK